jgi:uncharacterized membrane protein YfhO
MKKMIKKNKEEILIFLLAITISFICFLPIIINNNGVYYFQSDSLEQQYPFLMGYWQMIHDGTFFKGFQWSLGYGNNQLSYVFYNMLSPFNLLVYPLPKEWIKYSMTYLSIFKFGCLALSSSYWLKNLTNKFSLKLMGSLMLTFCGWILFYFHYNFLDVFVFYPLILYFIDEYLIKKKISGFIITVFLLTVINYYFSYLLIPFACLYALFRYLILTKNPTFKETFKTGLKFIILFVLSIGLAGFILIPCVHLLINTPRLTESLSVIGIVSKNDLFRTISTLFSPTTNFLDPYYFISSQVNLPYSGWGAGASIFTGSIIPLILIYFIINKTTKEKLYLVVFTIILLIFLIFPIFYKLFQGTIDTRWLYMFSILFVYISVYQLNQILDNGINRIKLSLSFIIYIILILVLFFISQRYYYRDIGFLRENIKIILVPVFFVLLYSITLLLKKPKYILIILIILETLFNFNLFISNNGPVGYDKNTFDVENNNVIDEIKTNDDSFYRILYGREKEILANKPFMDQIPGNSFYLSIYNFEQEYFFTSKSGWSMPQQAGFYGVRNLIGNKYLISDSNLLLYPIGYSKMNGYYLNDYFTGLGFFSNKTINSKVLLENNSDLLKNRILENYIVTDTSKNISYNFENELVTILDPYISDYIDISLENSVSDSILYIINGGIPNISLKLYNDDILVSESAYSQYGYIEVYLPPDIKIDRIVLNCDDTDNVGSPIQIKMLNNATIAFEDVYNNKKNYLLTNVKFDGDKITAIANIDKKMTLFTAIPYDIGWDLYVNGTKTEYEKVDLGFIGLTLESGEYEFEFIYHTPWLNYGLIFSIISAGILVVLIKKKVV